MTRHLLHQLLENAGHRHADRLAVIDLDRTVTYGELDTLANRIANLLVTHGVGRGDRVALLVEKSIEAVAAIYGIMKSGAAYVPLDPDAPSARLHQITGDCELKGIITQASKSRQWQELLTDDSSLELVLTLNGEEVPMAHPQVRILTPRDIDESPSEPVNVGVIDQDLAYILYTSGSTGQPKGVMLTHRNGMAFVSWASEQFAVESDDRLSSHAPLHFDLSIFDLYAAAYAGAAVVLVPKSASMFPAQVAAFIRENKVTVWYSVPSILSMLALRGGLSDTPVPSLRVVLFAGEVFPPKYLRQLMQVIPQARFANLYGPTETNVCTWYEVEKAPDDAAEPVPIGAPIPNDEVFALDEHGESPGIGGVGELFVRGATVMRGYWGDHAKTQEVLQPDPRGQEPLDPVYRTGDIVRLLPEGSFQFVGRRDAQIKSRGYRIEIGDIEATLNAHPDVLECAVIPVPDAVFTNRLLAYVAASGELGPSELFEFCAERIPKYMVPESFEIHEQLPKTSTGKIDRQSLLSKAIRAAAPESPS